MTRQINEDLEELLKKATGGDRQAFSMIVSRLMKPVAALTYRMTGDRESALDLAQETFLSVWQNLKDFRGDSSITAWIYRIASNKTLNYLKSQQRQIAATEQQPASLFNAETVSPEREYVKKELADGVLEFMSLLPDQQRLIFGLRFYNELSFSEIASIAGRAEGTIKTGYREAVRKLREYAMEKGWRS